MALPRDFAQQVKAAADIVRIVGDSVRLKRTGTNWSGLCPFHQEKTPSFTVNDQKGFYHDFSSGKHGDMTRGAMFLHVVNHKTYHRGWICQMFFDFGVKPPETDLCVFMCERT